MNTMMKTIQLPNEWRNVIDEIERTGEPVALELDGQICGVLLRRDEAQRVVNRYANRTPNTEQVAATSDRTETYLDLFGADPTLVPQIEGRPLRFTTMTNSGFINPQQFYHFQDPATNEVHVLRSDELQQAIGRWFAPVEFVADQLDAFWKERRNG